MDLRGMKGSKMCMKFSWWVQPFFGWISYRWRINVIEIHTLTVQYISHKWIKWVWFSNRKEYHIPHINGRLQHDFPTTGVQCISHKRRMWIWFPTTEVQNISHMWLNQGMIFWPHGSYSDQRQQYLNYQVYTCRGPNIIWALVI